jgi:hypothetical protein
MKLVLRAPTADTPNFLGFGEKLPDYLQLLKGLELNPSGIWRPDSIKLIKEIILFFAASSDKDAANELLNTLSANEIAEALASIVPELQKLMKGQGMIELEQTPD